jgi:ferredoxin--NADP+ reductase
MTRDLGLPDLDPAFDRVMICGSPEMLRDLRSLLTPRGFAEGSNTDPGDFVIEKAFAER